MRKITLNNGKALVIVAHPDDETIWMGGTILKNPEMRWTIFSLCRKSDPDRQPKYKKVCASYGARSIITDIEDVGRMNIRESVPRIKREIMKHCRGRRFSHIFTHGVNGEYGHPRHKGVHLAVKILLKNKLLSADSAFTFAYRGAPSKTFAVPDKNARLVSLLTNRELKEKRELIYSIYGFTKDSFEYKSCHRKEPFNPFVI